MLQALAVAAVPTTLGFLVFGVSRADQALAILVLKRKRVCRSEERAGDEGRKYGYAVV